MALNRHTIFLLFILFPAGIIFAQNPAVAGIPLAAEIQNTEWIINRQDVTGDQRHDALVRLARLRQLSGDIEGAAKNWLEAAAAIPGMVDDNALLSCAYCLASMGEWERASAALQPLLHKFPRARFLEISMNSLKTGDASALAAIADNPEYSPMKSEILFMLWKISGGALAETWRQRLLAEFPHSPEGRLAGENPSSAIIVKPSPFWLFMAGRDTFSRMETVAQAPTQTEPQPPVPQAEVSPVPQAESVRLQTGLFSRQANALAQEEQLKKAGFSPSIEQRTVNENEAYAVIVPAGQDVNRTIRELRNAGFDSFPLR